MLHRRAPAAAGPSRSLHWPQPPSHPRCAGPCSTSAAAAAAAEAGRHQRAAADPAEAPWSKDDLEALNEEVEAARDSRIGEEWRAAFAGDVEGLYEYVGDATAEWEQVVQDLHKLPPNEWQDSGELEAAHTFPPAMANELLGMGTWRMKGEVDACIEFLTQRIEGTWRELLLDDLNLYPRKKWKGKYDICDSMDVHRELGGMSYADVPNPRKGEEGYPRLLLENRMYTSRVFRKLHLEVAHRQDGLQVLHAVLYPRYAYDVPILAMDLVVAKGNVTLAIIDACPVRKNMQLPAHYLQTMQELQAAFLTDTAAARRIPDWGTAIFSAACVCIRPTTPAELAGFLRYAVALHRAHMQLAQLVGPVQGGDPRAVAKRAELLEGHKRFVDNQLANRKTSAVLEAAFGKAWADEYMARVMFDFEPEDEPKWADASLGRLYDHFDYNPELGVWPLQVKELEDSIAMKRANETLDLLVAGETVRQDKIEWALQTMFDRDAEFHSSVLALLPDAAEHLAQQPGRVGPYLAARLKELGLGTQEASWAA